MDVPLAPTGIMRGRDSSFSLAITSSSLRGPLQSLITGWCARVSILILGWTATGFWQPARKDPLEVLARMELTIENDTDLNKPKSSGKHRSRDESAGEDTGGGKKSMKKEASAGGGESTSVHMDD